MHKNKISIHFFRWLDFYVGVSLGFVLAMLGRVIF